MSEKRLSDERLAELRDIYTFSKGFDQLKANWLAKELLSHIAYLESSQRRRMELMERHKAHVDYDGDSWFITRQMISMKKDGAFGDEAFPTYAEAEAALIEALEDLEAGGERDA